MDEMLKQGDFMTNRLNRSHDLRNSGDRPRNPVLARPVLGNWVKGGLCPGSRQTMPKQIPEQEFEALLAIISQSAGGASLEEIEAKLEK